MFAAGSSQAAQVRTLLRAARRAAQECGWVTTAAEIGLDLVVRGPVRPRADATNYLGGVGDVLQDKVLGSDFDVSHLGELAAVALYGDDRQIRRIGYAEETAAQRGYTVRLTRVDAVPAQGDGPLAEAEVGETATGRGRRILAALSARGVDLGFTVRREYPVPGGRLDLVWLLPALEALTGDRPAPVAGFEIESSWRSRKHLKGDYLNLHDLGAAVGVLVLLGDGDDVEATRRFARAMVDRPGPRILVWSEEDVRRFLARGSSGAPPRH